MGRPRKLKTVEAERGSIGLPNPLEAAQEAARCAQEGNLKLAKAVETLRMGLEMMVEAEWDRETNAPVSAADLRKMAIGALDAYSAIAGQSWRRYKLSGATRAGDRNLNNLEA